MYIFTAASEELLLVLFSWPNFCDLQQIMQVPSKIFHLQECGTGIWMFCSSDVLAEFRCTTHNAKVLIF